MVHGRIGDPLVAEPRKVAQVTVEDNRAVCRRAWRLLLAPGGATPCPWCAQWIFSVESAGPAALAAALAAPLAAALLTALPTTAFTLTAAALTPTAPTLAANLVPESWWADHHPTGW